MSARHVPDVDRLAENQRRIERWHGTGDVDALWPEVAATDRRAAQAEVRATAEAVLRSAPELPALDASQVQHVRALGVAGFSSGMGALLGWWIDTGLIVASDPVRELFAGHLEHGRRRRSMLEAALVRVVRAMRGRGVEPIVLKGMHVGSVYFPESGTRPAADIDLLVEPSQRGAAATALRAAGFVETRRTRYAARSEWRPSDQAPTVHSLELDHADNPWAVDLHTSLERWYFRGLRRGLGDAFRDTCELSVAGETVRALSEPYLTAFLALHASHDLVKMQLVRLVELVLVIRARGDGFDWDRFVALTGRTSTARFTYPALWLAEILVPGTVSPAVLEAGKRSSTARTGRVLAEVVAADMGALSFRTLDNKLMWADGPRELLLNASELVVPSDDGALVAPPRLYWRGLRTLARGVFARRSARDEEADQRRRSSSM